MTDEREVCPECGHYHLYRRRPHVSTDPDAAAYRCENCGAEFDTPDTRPRRDTGRLPGHSLAAALDAADPSNVGADP